MQEPAAAFKKIIFMDSCCIFFCVANTLMHMRKAIPPFENFLNNLQSGAGLFAIFLLNWTISVLGLAMFNMSLYGGVDGKYRGPMSAILYTLYS